MAKIKHPTPEQLADYRRKAETGEHIGKNQLAQVFMALEKAERRAAMAGDMAQALRMMLEAYEMVLPGIAKISVSNYALINDAPCAARDALRALDTVEVL